MSQPLSIEIHRQVIYKNQTAIELLKGDEELSMEQIEQCFQNGAVWLETAGKPQRLYDPQILLKPGYKIHCYCNDTTLTPCPFNARLVADYQDFSIWNKPSGMLCQGSKWGDHWALYRWIKLNHWPQRESFITHRLDRFTSGLVIVAHTQDINKKFHRLFEQRQIKKTYRAVVNGLLSQPVMTLDTKIDGKSARTHVKLIEQQAKNEQSLVEIQPETGRKHQIRVHLAEIGHPVVNDRSYGQAPFTGDLMLQACQLDFSNPLDGADICISLNADELLSL